MARYGFNVAAFAITSSSTTGSFRNISNYVDFISGIDMEALTEEITAMQDTTPVGMAVFSGGLFGDGLFGDNTFGASGGLATPTQFPDIWAQFSFIGLNRFNAFTLEGFYDDTTAIGPQALFGDTAQLGEERVIKFAPDGLTSVTANAIKSRVLIQKYRTTPMRSELTRFVVTLVPTGAVTIPTT